MNIVTSWILKFMRYYDPETSELKYDETNSFYLLCYIMRELQYRHVYDNQLSKTIEHLQLIEANLRSGLPDLYDHLLDQMVENLAPYFTDIVMTMFVANLQDSSPEIASHIFDVFLIDGEKVVYSLLMKLIDLKVDTLLNLYEDELTDYLK